MRCLGPVVGVYTKKEAKAAGRPEIEGHKKRNGCGYNLGKLVDDVPADGEERIFKCPKCKRDVRVIKTPPLEEGEEA